MQRKAITLLLLVAAALAVPSTATAALRFKQLGDDRFAVPFRQRADAAGKIGPGAQATAASICVAAGFTHFEVEGVEAGKAKPGKAAKAEKSGKKSASQPATLRVKLHRQAAAAGAAARLECAPLADDEKVQAARVKLAPPAG